MTAKPTRVPFLPPHLHIILFFFSFLSCCPDHVTLHFLYTQTRRTCVRTVDGNRPHTGQSLQSTSALRLRLNNEDKINLSKQSEIQVTGNTLSKWVYSWHQIMLSFEGELVEKL